MDALIWASKCQSIPSGLPLNSNSLEIEVSEMLTQMNQFGKESIHNKMVFQLSLQLVNIGSSSDSWAKRDLSKLMTECLVVFMDNQSFQELQTVRKSGLSSWWKLFLKFTVTNGIVPTASMIVKSEIVLSSTHWLDLFLKKLQLNLLSRQSPFSESISLMITILARNHFWQPTVRMNLDPNSHFKRKPSLMLLTREVVLA